MRTHIVVLLLSLIFLFVLNVSSPKTIAQQNQFDIPLQTPQLKSGLTADVKDVLVEKESISAFCAVEAPDYECITTSARVKVTAISKDAENNKLAYYYTVSDGQIIGQGASVFWDFKGAKPRKHTITVAVGENYVVQGKSITKTIELSCSNCQGPEPPCICPTIEIFGPTKLFSRTDTIIFAAKVQGAGYRKIKYNWSVTNGSILAGQQTSQIMVKPGTDAGRVTATIQIGGTDPTCDCVTKLSKTVPIAGEKP